MHLTSYLGHYLPHQRNTSPNTIKAYRDVFTLLLRYCKEKRNIPPEKLKIEDLDAKMIADFLGYVQKERRCGEYTRNHRLAVLRSFFRYVQDEEPQLILHCQKILAIPMKRHETCEIGYLSPDEIASILNQPNLKTSIGRRDAVLLSLLYDTGARVQEIIDLTIHDVRLEPPAQIRLTGKGRKTRVVPLMKQTAQLVEGHMKEHNLNHDENSGNPLFANRYGERLSRSGVRIILEKHVESARVTTPSLRDGISPHTFRHSKAMHLLQVGNPLIVIKHILGHADIATTQMYVKADTEMKRKALEKAAGVSKPLAVPPWQKKPEIMGWLKSL